LGQLFILCPSKKTSVVFFAVYFTKKKNEVPASIQLYHAMLLNETGYYMLTLRTDNGRAEHDKS
jgi:hypothetical protein